MILIDAGPLVALINRGDPDHAACVAALAKIKPPLLTTWPAFTEAMYLLHRWAGWPGQQALWRMAERGVLLLAETTPEERERMPRLMAKYHDVPMDLADASLLAVAEARRIDRLFTLDGDFEIYRLPNKKRLMLIP